jgi:hypothetical protein
MAKLSAGRQPSGSGHRTFENEQRGGAEIAEMPEKPCPQLWHAACVLEGMTARTQIRSLIGMVLLVLVLTAAASKAGKVLARHYPSVAALEAIFLHPDGSAR